MHLTFYDVNYAYHNLTLDISTNKITTRLTQTRNGPARVIDEPVTVTYLYPRNRVLFNEQRDANPFFHLYESLWMLAGMNDVASVAKYVPGMAQYSDNGSTFHGAYGHRWRYWFGYDQLQLIIAEMKKNPESRRCVLQMWSGSADLQAAIAGGKDVPCNLSVCFLTRDNKLDMTVFNRSNDLVLGMLGANVVHMSFLQEYIADACGYEVGRYHQISNNLHVYEKDLPKISSNRDTGYTWYNYAIEPTRLGPNIDAELSPFVKDYNCKCWNNIFLERVAKPMLMAFDAHKRRNYMTALQALELVVSEDWRKAGIEWILRRKANWENKHGEASNQ